MLVIVVAELSCSVSHGIVDVVVVAFSDFPRTSAAFYILLTDFFSPHFFSSFIETTAAASDFNFCLAALSRALLVIPKFLFASLLYVSERKKVVLN